MVQTLLTLAGAFLINKPVGITSSGVVTQIKWALQNNGFTTKGFKIGHGGTLDPFATGLLIILLGEATKLADAYLHSQKAYDGLIQLGQETDTGDPTGTITLEKEVQLLKEEKWQEQAAYFVDQDYFQVPPMYSAKKRDGIALHVLARAGKTIERQPILKKIYSLDLNVREHSQLHFEVHCESGTYVRVLAEDLAKKNQNLAHLKTLRRTRSSDCSLEHSVSLDQLLEHLKSKKVLDEFSAYRKLETLGTHLPSVDLNELLTQQLRQGLKSAQEFTIGILQSKNLTSRYALARQGNLPVGLFEKLNDRNEFRLQRIFN